jgi:endonuclease/exonuclease/phosphatase family metal-dependent hydrolase
MKEPSFGHPHRDFNCAPASVPYRSFMEGGFVDTYLAASNEGSQGAHTFHAFEGPGHLVMRCGIRPRRIDRILLKGHQGRIRIRSHLIIGDYDEESGIYPSDHYPGLAELTLTGWRRENAGEHGRDGRA